MVPKSYENLPEGLVQRCFESITNREIKAPVTRNLVQGQFDLQETLSEVSLRLLNSAERQSELGSQNQMSETEFISTTQLQCNQLFEYHNKVTGFLP